MSLELYKLVAASDVEGVRKLLGAGIAESLMSLVRWAPKPDINFIHPDLKYSILTTAANKGNAEIVDLLLRYSATIKVGWQEVASATNPQIAEKLLTRALTNPKNTSSARFYKQIILLSKNPQLVQQIVTAYVENKSNSPIPLLKSILTATADAENNALRTNFWLQLARLKYKAKNNTEGNKYLDSLFKEGIDSELLPTNWSHITDQLSADETDFLSQVFQATDFTEIYMGIADACDQKTFTQFVATASPEAKHQLIIMATKRGQSDRVELLLKEGMSPELRKKVSLNYYRQLKITRLKIYADNYNLIRYFPTLLHIAAGEGDVETVKVLLTANAYSMPLSFAKYGQMFPESPNTKMLAKPIFFAAHSKKADELIRIFLEHTKTLPQNTTERYSASELNTLAELALETGLDELYTFIDEFRKNYQSADKDRVYPDNFRTEAHKMASLGRVKLLQDVLRKNPSASNLELSHFTLLQRACLDGQLEAVKFLVEEGGADANARLENDEANSSSFSIDPNNNINQNNYISSYTPLQLAVINSHIAVVQYLLMQTKCLVNINALNDLGLSALHLAQDKPEIYALLLKYSANSNITDPQGNIPKVTQNNAQMKDEPKEPDTASKTTPPVAPEMTQISAADAYTLMPESLSDVVQTLQGKPNTGNGTVIEFKMVDKTEMGVDWNTGEAEAPVPPPSTEAPVIPPSTEAPIAEKEALERQADFQTTKTPTAPATNTSLPRHH